MFAKVPLASHVANPRSRGWTNKHCFLRGEAVKYCGHFFPSVESLFSTDFCGAERCFLVAKWYSHRCPLSTSCMEWNTVKNRQTTTTQASGPDGNWGHGNLPFLENHTIGTKNSQEAFILLPITSPPLKFSSLGKIHFMPKSFLVSTFRSHYCWQLNQTSHKMQPYLSVREKPSFQTPWPPFHHNLQASVKMYCTL